MSMGGACPICYDNGYMWLGSELCLCPIGQEIQDLIYKRQDAAEGMSMNKYIRTCKIEMRDFTFYGPIIGECSNHGTEQKPEWYVELLAEEYGYLYYKQGMDEGVMVQEPAFEAFRVDPSFGIIKYLAYERENGLYVIRHGDVAWEKGWWVTGLQALSASGFYPSVKEAFEGEIKLTSQLILDLASQLSDNCAYRHEMTKNIEELDTPILGTVASWSANDLMVMARMGCTFDEWFIIHAPEGILEEKVMVLDKKFFVHQIADNPIRLHLSVFNEMCRECQSNVGPGSGKYINRIPVIDGPGEWVCESCDEKRTEGGV